MAGKPAKQIDIEQLETLARLHCTIDEAASVLKCCKRTLLRYLDPKSRDPKYREAWERGRDNGKASLRRLQWQHANGSGSSAVQMTIHLSKHWLGETEKSLIDHTSSDGSMTPKPTTIRITGPDDGSDDKAPAEGDPGVHAGKR